MYMVEVIYGMESYQNERREFDNQKDAIEYYKEWVYKNPVRLRIYELILEAKM